MSTPQEYHGPLRIKPQAKGTLTISGFSLPKVAKDQEKKVLGELPN